MMRLDFRVSAAPGLLLRIMVDQTPTWVEGHSLRGLFDRAVKHRSLSHTSEFPGYQADGGSL